MVKMKKMLNIIRLYAVFHVIWNVDLMEYATIRWVPVNVSVRLVEAVAVAKKVSFNHLFVNHILL